MFFGTIKLKIIFKEFIINKITSLNGISPLFIDFIYDNGFFFLVFEYIESDSLKEIINEYSPEEKKEYFLAISSVLLKFHKLGFIHRDIKPQNFLYNRKDKKAYIIDFGLSHSSSHENKLKNHKFSNKLSEYIEIFKNFENFFCPKPHRMGTDGFMAPEVNFSNKKHIDESSDVWSMGVILMQLFFKKEYIFTQKMIVYEKEKLALKNIKNSHLVILLELANLFGVKRVKKVLEEMGIYFEIPDVFDMNDLKSVFLFVLFNM